MEADSLIKYSPTATDQGLYLYKVNFVSWEQILSAKKLSFFGLPYMILRLKVRRPPFWSKTWWVPLYFGDMSPSVTKWSPNGHPVRTLFEEGGPRVSFSEGALLYAQAIVVIGIIVYIISVI